MGLVLLILIAVVAVVGAGVSLLIYNRMVSRRNAVDNSWAQIEAALKRRHDLIPNLVEAVKGYAEARADDLRERDQGARQRGRPRRARRSRPPPRATLGAAIGRLMVVAEQYPELRATENFQQLQGAADARPRTRSRSPAASTTTRSRPTTR